MTNKKNIIAIIGPTAVGKTSLSLKLAQKINAEIVSVDSRQVYRYMNVGTDKVDFETRQIIPHHLIDIVDPDQVYSAADFCRDATSTIERIQKRGKTVLLVGGTPFYYKALTGLLSKDLPKSETVRKEIEKDISSNGLLNLYKELLTIDPQYAAKIHPNDVVRIMRAIEIYKITGKNTTWWHMNQKKIDCKYNILYLGLIKSRSVLYKNIEQRVKNQFENGYVEEVEWLLNNGYSPELPALRGFGYKDIINYINGGCSFLEAINSDIKQTKTFSRKQMTWFKHFEPTKWYNFDSMTADFILDDAFKIIRKYLKMDI